MKILVLIARILLGLIFLVFGLNGFLHFLPMPPVPGLAGQYLGLLVSSHMDVIVFLCQVLGGVLFLLNRYVALALTLVAPVIVNILSFHLLLAPSGLPLAIVVLILWLVVFWRVRERFAGLLTPAGSS